MGDHVVQDPDQKGARHEERHDDGEKDDVSHGAG
jgi:hypothetical protein